MRPTGALLHTNYHFSLDVVNTVKKIFLYYQGLQVLLLWWN